MRQTTSLAGKVRLLLTILLPILITQIALVATAFFDTVMAGQVSRQDLAGVAIGANIWIPVFTGLNGIIIGITPILAQLHGAGRKESMAPVVVQGLWLSAALALLVLAGGSLAVDPLLAALDLEADVAAVARRFLIGISIGVLPLFASSILRNFIDSLGYTRVTMVTSLCALPINVLLNYLLIFGKAGFPALGGAGAGFATGFTFWCVLLINALIVYRLPPFRDYRVFARLYAPAITAWRKQLRIGLPIGLAIFSEVSIFSAVGVLMAGYGTAVIGAHQAAINFASLVYMLPLSIGMALTIVVGFELGAGRPADAKAYSYIGLGLAVAAAAVGGAGLFRYTAPVAGLYTSDPEVLELTKAFLAYAVFFQLSDAIAAPVQGALRGYKDVKAAMVMAIISYWGVGLPAGYWLSKTTQLGPFGYWVGLIAGLAFGAVVLLGRLRRLQKKHECGFSHNQRNFQ